MDNYIGLLVSILVIILGVMMNVFVGFSLIICWVVFAVISFRKGYGLKSILKISYVGGKKAWVVIKILLLIGAVTGAWMISGTIPAIVYYALRLIRPDIFILLAFLISCAASFVLGSSTGTVTILGLPLIIIARGGGVNLDVVAGAIIAGAYFGDRCSPMTSSAALVANLTGTNLFKNIKNMLYSSIIPFILSVGFYYALSERNPLKVSNSHLTHGILAIFRIEYPVLIPVVLLLVLCLFRISVRYAMLFSILVAFMVAVFLQRYPPLQVLQAIFFGFHLKAHNSLGSIFDSGGITSMLKAGFVVFAACALAGILQEIGTFSGLKHLLSNMKLRGHMRYGLTTVVSTLSAAVGASQSIAVVMTDEIMRDCYKQGENDQFALDIENSCILTSALIPWNIAALIGTAALGVSMSGFVPYAFYLYIFPVVYFLSFWFRETRLKKLSSYHAGKFIGRVG